MLVTLRVQPFMSSWDQVKTSLYSLNSAIIASFCLGGEFFAIESTRGSIVVLTLTSPNVEAVTRCEISISRSNVARVLLSSSNDSGSGSYASS